MSLAFVKYCPLCGAENTRQQPFCSGCSEDLTRVQVEPRRGVETVPEPDAPAEEALLRTRRVESPACDGCVLELVADPTVRFTVRADQTVGRTGAADIALEGKVPDWQYISGCHARFTRRGGQWYVAHAGTTNFNIVDGVKYAGDDEAALHDNSVLVLAKTAFRVCIEGMSDAERDKANDG